LNYVSKLFLLGFYVLETVYYSIITWHIALIMLPYLSISNCRKLCLLTQLMFLYSPVDNIA